MSRRIGNFVTEHPVREWLYGSDAVLSVLSGSRMRSHPHTLLLLPSTHDDFIDGHQGNGDDDDDSSQSSLSLRRLKSPPKSEVVRRCALDAAKKLGVNVEYAQRHDLDRLSGGRPHNGMLLHVDAIVPPLISTPEQLFQRPANRIVCSEDSDQHVQNNNDVGIAVALDQVVDPQNLGAIIRACCFFGASPIVLCARNSAPLSPVVAKAATGALDQVDLRSCQSMPRFLAKIHDDNRWHIAGMTARNNSVPLNELKTNSRRNVLLVLGNEGEGLRPLVERQCHALYEIAAATSSKRDAVQFSVWKGVDSLNVASALSIALFHCNHAFGKQL